jgi:zinc protease
MGIFVTPRAGAELSSALVSVEKVIERFRAEGPTAEELARAKIQLERAWLEGQQSLAERSQTLSSYAAIIGDVRGLGRDFKSLLGLSAVDLRRAARRWLKPSSRRILEIVPGAALPTPPPKALAEPPAPDPRTAPPASPPPAGAPRDPRPIDLDRFTLGNGLDVYLVRDRRLPLIEFRLGLRAGRALESSGEDALSLACEELLFKGRSGCDAATVAREFSALGWAVGANSEAEWLKISASGLSRSFAKFTALLAATLVEASYPDDEVSLWRENAVEELTIRRSSASFLLEERLRAELFPGHPYSRGAASEAELTAVDPDRLRRYHASRVRPGGGYLVLVGDLDTGEARRVLEAAFAGWPGKAGSHAVPELPEHGKSRIVLVDRPGSAQASIAVAQMLPLTPREPDYLSFALANHILGGTANSRLFDSLRTRRGFTYGAYSSLEVYGRGAVWSASADVRPDAVRAAIDEIAALADELRRTPPPAADVASSKRHLGGLFLMRLASMDRTASYVAAVIDSGRDPAAAIASYQTRLNAISPDSAFESWRTRLDPNKFVSVVVGDAASLKPLLGL